MSQSLQDVVSAGDGLQPADDYGSGIYGAKGVANAYLVTTGEGDVLINTGMASTALEIKRRFAEVSEGPLKVIIFTQGHPDHVGGWSEFTGPGVETIAQANHSEVREYWRRLRPFYGRRVARLWGQFRPSAKENAYPQEATVTTTFVDTHAVTLGGRRFELYATPGGETLDSLIVWMPEDRTVFIGNLLGPMFGHVPNLYTIRGDKVRSAFSFMDGIDRVLALEPDVLYNGHFRFVGRDSIRETLLLVQSATKSLRDQTIDGMNAGQTLWELMDSVALPDELSIPQLHGKVPWIVRAIYEEHVGWFRYESTTELYSVPPSAVWSDILDVAGARPLGERALAHAEQGRPLEAIHLAEIVLSGTPGHLDALDAKRKALETLLERSGQENFSEVQWLKTEIAAIEEARSR